MAKLVMAVVEKRGVYEVGDVIEVVSDAHVFSVLEHANPHWVILHVAELDAASVQNMKEVFADARAYRKQRALDPSKIDLSALDEKRVVAITAAQFTAARVERAHPSKVSLG